MISLSDILSVVARAVSFVLVFQAAGAVFFAAAFGPALTISLTGIRKLTRATALAAICAVAAHYVLESARMAGDMSGILDGSLQAQVWNSSSGAAFAVRILGLLLIFAGARTAPGRLAASRFFAGAAPSRPFAVGRFSARGFTSVGVAGAMLVAVSFTLTGHTSTNPRRWLLAPLLLAHLLIVAFWFGALWPLCLVTLRESQERVARVITVFSAAAVWLVPLILVAGVAMAALLLPNIAALTQPYGELLIVKVGLFAVLLCFGAFNKWRFGPAIGRGDPLAAQRFRRVTLSEFGLIAAVLSVTAVMTSIFSPD
jgi:putative copper resistance protein D